MPEREIDEDILNFHFIAIATAKYDDGYCLTCRSTQRSQGLAGWFCDKKLADRVFTHRYPKLAKDRRKRR